MATLFKRSDKPGAPWYVSFYTVTSTGRKKRRIISTGTRDKATAKQIAAKYESEAAVRAHGVIDAKQELQKQSAKTAIEDVLPAFEAKMRRKGTESSKNSRQTLKYVRDYCKNSGAKTLTDIQADACNTFKVHLFELGRSARTVQANVNALKHFSRWLVTTQRLGSDPLVGVKSPNPEDDRRKERRMLLPDEWSWLVRGTLKAGHHSKMDASERVLLYRTAIQTGLRSEELRALKRGSFHLGGDAPFLKVASKNTKNSQIAHQNVDLTLAADLREHLSTKLPGAAAFSMPSPSRVVDMIRRDLRAARKLWLESADDPQIRSEREESDFLENVNGANEVFDFHALRHTCGGWLALRGVQLKVIQAVMRHSEITLTMDTYGHLVKGAEAAAIAGSADLTAVPALATGTDGPETRFPIASKQGACGVPNGAEPCETPADAAITIANVGKRKKPQNSKGNAALCGPVHGGASSGGHGTRTRNCSAATDFESATIAQNTRETRTKARCASLLLPTANAPGLQQEITRLTSRMTTGDLEAVVKLCRKIVDQ